MKQLAPLLLAAPFALAACGGGSSGAHVKVDPVAYVKRAASKTAAVTSYHFAVTGKTVGNTPLQASITSSGDYSNAKKEGQLLLSVSAPGRSVQVTVIESGTEVYVQSSMSFGARLWAKLDARKLVQPGGTDFFSSLVSPNATQVMRQLEAAGSVMSLGTETIDGAETTHYRVTKIPHFGPIDVWIGNSSRYVYRVSTTATGHPVAFSQRVDLSNFGESVHVSVPAASETVNVPSLDAALGIGG